MVLLGLGGKALSESHILETAAALNRMQPRLLSFLTLMLIPGTRLFQAAQVGTFEELGPLEMLYEMRMMIAALELERTVFRSDHASNFLPLEGRFPADKERLLSVLDRAIDGKINRKPDLLRGL